MPWPFGNAAALYGFTPPGAGFKEQEMEAGTLVQTILMEVSAIAVLAVLVAFAVWVSRSEKKATTETVEAIRPQ